MWKVPWELSGGNGILSRFGMIGGISLGVNYPWENFLQEKFFMEELSSKETF
jgi:hypothetical protein